MAWLNEHWTIFLSGLSGLSFVVSDWFAANWTASMTLSVFSLIVSIFAFVLSFKKHRFETRPELILRRGKEGYEIENIGRAAATNVSITLIERTKRPSARLRTTDLLKPNEKDVIYAEDWPDALEPELQKNIVPSMGAMILRMGGEKVHYDGKAVASYLLQREQQMIVVRYRVQAKSKPIVSLFKASNRKNAFSEILPRHRILNNRISIFIIEKWTVNNPEFAVPWTFPNRERQKEEKENTQQKITSSDD